MNLDVKNLKMAPQLQQIPVTSNDPSPAGSQPCTQNQIRGVAYGNYSGHRCRGCCTVAETKKFQNRDMGLFAIYSSAPNSGHVNVPRYLQGNLFSNILKQPGFWSNPEKAIVEAFRETKAGILKDEVAWGNGNCRAVTAMVIDGRQLLVANAGDSKAILCRAGTAVQLSIDYKRITNPPWINIRDDLHEIEKKEGMGVREELIDWATEFLILASDGVWETMGHEEAVDLLKDVMDPDTAAKLLVDRAAEKGSSTEILSCIVIRFQ